MKVKVNKLKHHPLNSKIYNLSNIEDLVKSINDVGLLQKIVINKKFEVISGNRRFESIKRLKWKEVDVEMASDLKKKDEPKFLVHHNKQRIKTAREQINEIKILLPEFKIGQGKRNDLTSANIRRSEDWRKSLGDNIGLSRDTIHRLLFIEENQSDLIDLIDKDILTINQAYLQCKRFVKESESRKLSDNKITKQKKSEQFIFYNKCSSKMLEIDSNKVDLIFTSPPYWNKRQYTENKGLGNEKNPDKFVDNLVNHFNDCKRVLKKSGSFFIVIGDTFKDGNLLNIPHKVCIGLQDKGWILRNTIIWSKTNPKPSSSKSNLTPSYEYIFHLVKSNQYKYHQILTKLKDSTKPSHSPRHRNLNGHTRVNPYIPREGKNIGDYWNEDIVRTAVMNNVFYDTTKEHPAPFPENIITIPILQTTDVNDLVVDPFMGTGTTGKVANSFDRKFIGYDIQSY